MGAVASVLVDIDEAVPGRIDERPAIVFAEQASASNYGLVDEIATALSQLAVASLVSEKPILREASRSLPFCATRCECQGDFAARLTTGLELENPVFRASRARCIADRVGR